MYRKPVCVAVGIGSLPVMMCQLDHLKTLLCHQTTVYRQMFEANSVLHTSCYITE